MNRTFLPTTFELASWEAIEPLFTDLLDRKVDSVEGLEQWISDRAELDAFLSEDFAWRYIRMSCKSDDSKLEEKFQFFVRDIQPHLSPMSHKLNEKFLASEFLSALDHDTYWIMIRGVKKSVDLFREENVALEMEEEELSQEFGKLAGAMTVEHGGEELTMQQASLKLEDEDRSLRESMYRKIWERRLSDQEALDTLMDKLVALRHKIATNAGFDNYRDYKFAAMGRFDYTPEDATKFHAAVKKNVVPFTKKLLEERQSKLGLEVLKPWDLAVDPDQKGPLRPYRDADELVEKTIQGFSKLNPDFGKFINIQREKGFLDLDSRKAKRPGGFNYPLAESGVPFIFMNSVGSQRDLETMVHEGGHAIHAFYCQDLPVFYTRSTPMEVAELASMAMEMLSMDFWDLFYDNADDLARAKKEKIEDSLTILPWIAQVDSFQHWMYTHPEHTADERKAHWKSLVHDFGTDLVDHSDMPAAQDYRWQTQLHIYEVPFYYIEYGFCQLGALGVWKNFLEDRDKALQQYEAFMRLGYLKTIPEIYQTAGVSFDFSDEYVADLVSLVESHLSN